MAAASVSELARSIELCRGFDPAEAERLMYRLNGVRKVYSEGDVVVHAGMPADRLLAVVSGRLHVYQRVLDDREVLVREIGPDTVLGLWMLHMPDIANWPATVVAAERCVAISLGLGSARRFLMSGDQEAAKFALNSSRILSRELFSVWRKLSVMSEQNLTDRLHMYLAELHHENGDTGEVVVPFNREKMAEYFGVTRPALSRALGQMRDRGLIDWRKNVFKIKF